MNQSIDTDERLEKMCPRCREEATSNKHRCIVCGKSFSTDGDGETFVNPNFDVNKFNRLSKGLNGEEDDSDEPIIEMEEDI